MRKIKVSRKGFPFVSDRNRTDQHMESWTGNSARRQSLLARAASS